MKKTIYLLGIILMSSVMLNSCKKKSDDDSTPTPAKSELIVGTWVMSAMTIDPPIDFFGTPISDLYALFDACEKDDEYTMNKDKSYVFTSGTLKCDPSEPDIQDEGTWSLNADNTVLTTISSSGGTDQVNVKSLSSSTAVFTFTELDSASNVTYTYTQTLKKK
jgi:hypothetical protein